MATSTALIEAMFCILVTWNERFTQKFSVNQFLSSQFLIKKRQQKQKQYQVLLYYKDKTPK